MDKNDLRSQSLDLLRFPLAVVVLVIHTFSTSGFKLQGVSISLADAPVLLEVNHFIDGFLRGQSVPIYFFISGFVFFWGVELTKEKYLQKLKNRVKTLLIPYVIWNTIFVLKAFFLHLPCFSSLFPNLHKVHFDFSLSAILETFWDNSKGILTMPASVDDAASAAIYPADVPLWFIRDLMIVILCTPILYRILNHTRCYFVWMLGGLWFALAYRDFGHAYQLLTAFFFFSWGAYMSVNKKDMMHEFSRFFKASLLLYPLLALLFVWSVHYFPNASDTIKRLNVVAGLFFAYNTSSWLLAHHVCKVSPFLASSSFFIYIAHALICGNCLKLLFSIFRPATDFGMLSIYISAVAATLAMLLLSFYLLRRYTPKLLKAITGRE
ncbi:acyltransferase family protein [uncultured Alistipes sp.]|jgi:fucose 4-O-acetylase-like acetyltransferase|uniref:acyltransferase family protein n=1 Tax=uncultured Alistipes sp. TaxID=538949 RepID=UPI0025E1A323|nr:acyltransferase family protein [uncultured Alistipes sp.]